MQIEYSIDRRYQKFRPLMNIPLEMASPSTLHIPLGVGTDFVKQLIRLAKSIDSEQAPNSPSVAHKIEETLKSHRIERRAYFMEFTGSSLHKVKAIV